ncbi:XRE family transcriptional regulator [Alkalihalophilus marmarensis]|uniref:LexA family protein n=1 Tax=Alkalihalophilus marmarensis TaxID=521377 RepID=UPI000410BC0B|nr:XRE family transcriptional regulator [Alkalihalophilus marmarensis]MCM3489108.1 XRE family transcriptional regulator [Alkalihalophilus marmarensis]
MTVGKLIKSIRTSNKLTQSEFAKILGVAPTAVSAWERDSNRPLMDKIVMISKRFNVEINEFFEDYTENKALDQVAEPINHYNIQHVELPLYGSVAAGALATIEGITEENLKHIKVPVEMLGKYSHSKDLFTMRVNGDSMNRIIPDGSLVICKPIEFTAIQDNDILIFSHDGEYSMKRFWKDPEDGSLIFSPESTNRRFRELAIDSTTCRDLQIYAKVIGYSVVLD